MTDKGVRWLTEADVVDLVDLEDAIEALERGLRWEGEGKAQNVPKALGTWGDGSSMHSLGSMFPEAGYVGFKTWANTKRGAAAVFALFDANNGALLALMEAAGLGQMRTSAISGLASRWLAREDATTMALIGSGLQSMTQVAAVAAVRPLSEVRVFSPTPDKRRAFVEKAKASFGFEVKEAASLEAATEGADIVTAVTRAREPFIEARHLDKGAHFNAVGAILPANAEFTQDVFDRASLLVVEHLPNVKLASREFRERFGEDEAGWGGVRLLSDVIAKGEQRPADADLTLFKAMGMGISDLSVAVTVYERALEREVGAFVEQAPRRTPRWRTAVTASAA